jgi:hypothetical protein
VENDERGLSGEEGTILPGCGCAGQDQEQERNAEFDYLIIWLFGY